jgi:hypothetical protein
VWGADVIAGTGVYGHVAICLGDATKDTFVAMGENWPTGSPCHRLTFGFHGVRGWLRPTHLVLGATQQAPALPRTSPPPATAAIMVDVLTRHAADLAKRGSPVVEVNRLLDAIKTWPQVKS